MDNYESEVPSPEAAKIESPQDRQKAREDALANLFNKALKMREEKTSTAENIAEFKKNLAENPGFIKAMWCGERSCEDQVKEETGASIRCIPFEAEQEVLYEGKCVCCGKPAEKMAYFARAY